MDAGPVSFRRATLADAAGVAQVWLCSFGTALPMVGQVHTPEQVWLDVAREYTERWTHQQQIREAVGSPRLDPVQVEAVIATVVHALPVALVCAPAADGTTVAFTVTGNGGGRWQLTRRSGRWQLQAGTPPNPAASVTTTVDAAWRLFTQHPRTPPPTVAGDPTLTNAIRAATAIIR